MIRDRVRLQHKERSRIKAYGPAKITMTIGKNYVWQSNGLEGNKKGKILGNGTTGQSFLNLLTIHVLSTQNTVNQYENSRLPPATTLPLSHLSLVYLPCCETSFKAIPKQSHEKPTHPSRRAKGLYLISGLCYHSQERSHSLLGTPERKQSGLIAHHLPLPVNNWFGF